MAKRRHFIAELYEPGKGAYAMTEKYAKNSAIRASEALVRDHARNVGGPFTGEHPQTYGDEYRRVWVGPTGERVHVKVMEVFS